MDRDGFSEEYSAHLRAEAGRTSGLARRPPNFEKQNTLSFVLTLQSPLILSYALMRLGMESRTIRRHHGIYQCR